MNIICIDWGYGIGSEDFSSRKIAEKVYNKLERLYIPAVMNSIIERKDSNTYTLISIGSNWSENTNQKGIETYYNCMSKTGELLAKKIQRELIKATGLYSRGIIGCSNKTNPMLSSLLESYETSAASMIGFYSNPRERSLLEQDSFQELISDGIINGLIKYMKLKDKHM